MTYKLWLLETETLNYWQRLSELISVWCIRTIFKLYSVSSHSLPSDDLRTGPNWLTPPTIYRCLPIVTISMPLLAVGRWPMVIQEPQTPVSDLVICSTEDLAPPTLLPPATMILDTPSWLVKWLLASLRELSDLVDDWPGLYSSTEETCCFAGLIHPPFVSETNYYE